MVYHGCHRNRACSTSYEVGLKEVQRAPLLTVLLLIALRLANLGVWCRKGASPQDSREAAGRGGGAAAMLASPASPREAQADAEGSSRGGKGGSSKLAGATVFENPLASHPIPADAELPANASSAVPVATPAATPPRPKGGGRRRLDVAPPSPVSSLGTASAASAGASGRGLSAPPEGHVRRLTQNLVEILESLSGSVALPGQHHRTASTSSSRGASALPASLALQLPKTACYFCHYLLHALHHAWQAPIPPHLTPPHPAPPSHTTHPLHQPRHPPPPRIPTHTHTLPALPLQTCCQGLLAAATLLPPWQTWNRGGAARAAVPAAPLPSLLHLASRAARQAMLLWCPCSMCAG